MGNLILSFLQEQGILIVMGLMVLEGVVQQWAASRRYRRLRDGIQLLISTYGQGEVSHQVGQATYGKSTEMAEPVAEISTGARKRDRRTNRRQEVGHSAPEFATGMETALRSQTQEPQRPQPKQQSQQGQQELDAQLLYLKQSLDRIAAGRDQKLEEEPREHRKLTPEQEAVIADILREYLS